VGELASTLRNLRRQQKLSVRELAKRSGVSVSYIYAIEAGSRGSNLSKLDQIADALQVPISDLWLGKQP
jgi:transcriptional regulator with XRE-family HTH domain